MSPDRRRAETAADPSRRDLIATIAALGGLSLLPSLSKDATAAPATRAIDFHHHFNPPFLVNAAANNRVGGVKVMPIRVDDGTANGVNALRMSKALNYAVFNNRAQIINVSLDLDRFVTGGVPDPVFSAALDSAYAAGALIVASAGNDNTANPARGVFTQVLFVANTDSLAERSQRAVPEARVVKSLNVVTAEVQVDPASVGGGRADMFVAGDDQEAKLRTTELLQAYGWTTIHDLGGLGAARGLEMLMPLWLSLMGTLDTWRFGYRIVTDDSGDH